MDNKILTLVYTFFIGVMLSLFVGLGISTFYPSPQAPEYPVSTFEGKSEPTEADTDKLRAYEQEMQTYQDESQQYNRNVTIIALISAVVLLVISLSFEKFNSVIANGVLLGSLFTLLYSVIRGFASQDSQLTFITVSIGLVIALYLGYRRFARPKEPPKAKLISKKKSAR